MLFRCLIVDKLHKSIGAMLKAIAVDYDYHPKITRDEIKRILPQYEGLIIRSKTTVDKDLLGDAKLKFVARAGAGIDNLDVDLLTTRGIEIFNAPEGNRDAVGEHTIGLILSLLHNLSQGNNQVVKGIWDREGNRGMELGNLTVGIYGCGNTGSALAKKLSGFGCKVIAYDKYLKHLAHNYAELVDLETFFKQTDILSLHIPLTDETNGLADSMFFNRFKNQLIFINTSRGEIAPLKDLLAGLENDKIRYAGLDVLENEKLDKMNAQESAVFTLLKSSGKVIFTPHVAGWTHESYQRINAVLAEKIAAFLEHS